MSDLECKTCDTNTAEPEAPKVIVVTEAPVGDRAPVERRYLADAEEGADYGYLHLVRDGRQIARYQPMAWLSVREDGSSAGDPYFRQGKKLAIALDALRAIAHLNAGDGMDVNDAMAMADRAFEKIAELDL